MVAPQRAMCQVYEVYCWYMLARSTFVFSLQWVGEGRVS